MTEVEIKMECLRFALESRKDSYTSRNIIEAAEKFYEFVIGEKKETK